MKKGAAPTGQAAHPAAEEYAAAEQRRHVRRPRHARLAAAQLGRSRGGPTGKVHRSADRSRRPLSFAVAPARPVTARSSQPSRRRPRSAARPGAHAPALTWSPPTRPASPAPASPPAQTRHQSRDPRQGRPGREPQETRPVHRPTRPSSATPSPPRCATPHNAAPTRPKPGPAIHSDEQPDSHLTGPQLPGSITWTHSLKPSTRPQPQTRPSLAGNGAGNRRKARCRPTPVLPWRIAESPRVWSRSMPSTPT